MSSNYPYPPPPNPPSSSPLPPTPTRDQMQTPAPPMPLLPMPTPPKTWSWEEVFAACASLNVWLVEFINDDNRQTLSQFEYDQIISKANQWMHSLQFYLAVAVHKDIKGKTGK